MAASRSQEIRVGVVTVVALVALVAGILWGKGLVVGVHQLTIKMDFPRAGGVDIGAPVRIYGVRKGSVTAVEVMETGVRITATVEPAVALHPDATASLQMVELMGGKAIEIQPGNAPGKLADGALIEGRIEGDVADLLGSADKISEDARTLLHRLDSAVQATTAIINDPALRQGIKSTVANLEQASSAANDLVAANQATITETVRNLNELARDLKSIAGRADVAIDKTLGTLDAVSTDAHTVIVDAGGAARKADSLIARLDKVVLDIQKGDGTISMLLYDPAFARQLAATVRDARAYLNDIQKNGIVLKHKIDF
jgi:phospholipid/cholesterol/gamma-HCH transport system substrate-binding protein